MEGALKTIFFPNLERCGYACGWLTKTPMASIFSEKNNLESHNLAFFRKSNFVSEFRSAMTLFCISRILICDPFSGRM